MQFDYADQVNYTKLALAVLGVENDNPKSVETILNLGELIKKHSSADNAVIHDATEYIGEQLGLLRGEKGALNDIALRSQLEEYIANYENRTSDVWLNP